MLKKSSSGGLSHAICREIIEQNGVVYGVALSSDSQVLIERADSIEKCELFYGSKYVQANPNNTLEMVKKDLIEGKKVLYIATSCYIAGLLSYLKYKNVMIDNLYTVDLICHGVPSPLIFSDYVRWINEKRTVSKFYFRTKKKPWGYGSRNYGCTIKYVDGKEEVDTIRARVFLNLFFSNNCLRPHCHHCEYAGIDKPADLTVADYWGCIEQEPEFYDKLGVSAVLVHTDKGLELIRNAQELEYKDTPIEKIKMNQGNLNHPSPIANSREQFWNEYTENGFLYIAKKYGGLNIKGIIINSKIYATYAKLKTGRSS